MTGYYIQKQFQSTKNTFETIFKASYSTYEYAWLMKKEYLMHVLTPLLISNANSQDFSLWIMKTVSLSILPLVIMFLV